MCNFLYFLCSYCCDFGHNGWIKLVPIPNEQNPTLEREEIQTTVRVRQEGI